MACLFGHKWDGCRCTKCGKLRKGHHSWQETGDCYKTCTTCKVAETNHKWVKKDNHMVCEKCGIFGLDFNAKNAQYASELIQPALSQYGDGVFDLPYVYRSLIEKLKSKKDVILDAHELAGYHLLLKTSFIALSNMASPTAGGLMSGNIPDAAALKKMDAAFQRRNEVRTNLGILQKQLGESAENDIDMSSPAMKKKLGMYLDK